MARTKRNPGAGGTGVSGKNVPVKNSPDHIQTRGTAQPKTRKPATSYAGARRTYTVYDGRTLFGTFVWNERTQQALAWNASRRFVGQFGSYKAAARAIGQAAVTARQMAEARRRLEDPHPPFATGLPEHFLRRG
jgi:hypothetical protein